MLAKVLLLATSIVFGFLTLELGVRWYGYVPVDSEMRYQPDPVLHHRFVPNKQGVHRSELGEFRTQISVNSLGLRDREISLVKPIGQRRILLLGDSFLAALEVRLEDSVAYRLESRLNGTAESPVPNRVVNAGHGSYSPILEYLFLKTQGLRLSPDAIILSFAMNDVTEDFRYGQSADFDADGLPLRVLPPVVREPEGKLPVPLKPILQKYSAFYKVIRNRYHTLRSWLSEESLNTMESQRPLRTHDLRTDPFAIFKIDYSIEEEKAWLDTEKYLAAIVKIARTHSLPIIIVVIPEPPQINSWEWQSGKQIWGYGSDEIIDFPAMQERMRTIGERLGVPVIDPTLAFRNASGPSRIFFDFDGHLTPYGHGVFADVLFDAILENDLLSE